MTADPATGEPYKRIKRTMESISGRVRQEAGSLDRSEVNAFVAEIIATHESRHRIFLLGEGRSGLVARSFAMRLMHLGFDVYVFGEVVTLAVKTNQGEGARSGKVMALADDDAGEDGNHGKHARRERQQQAETEEARHHQPEIAAFKQGGDAGGFGAILFPGSGRGCLARRRLRGWRIVGRPPLRFLALPGPAGSRRKFFVSADSTRLFRCNPDSWQAG